MLGLVYTSWDPDRHCDDNDDDGDDGDNGGGDDDDGDGDGGTPAPNTQNPVLYLCTQMARRSNTARC